MDNYDNELLPFMLFDGSFAQNDFSLMTETVENGLLFQGAPDVSCPQFDTFSGSPEFSWQIDDKVSENAREECSASGSAMKTKRDRSKTLVSERKRRVRMKEKLYELRSLVPNITKMDKASIIADAVVYVEDLKSQSKKLVEEINMLKSSSNVYQVLEASNKNAIEVAPLQKTSTSLGSKITKVDVHALDGLYYVKVRGGMNNGVPSSLYTAIESFSCFHLENSNFSMITSKDFELVLTFKVGGFGEGINASNMRLWFLGALVKQGFEIERTLLA